MSTAALEALTAALVAGTQPPPPITDPVVLTSALNAGLAPKAPIASPEFTGIPTGPTATAGTGTAQLATTQFVATAIAAIPTGGGTASGTPTSRQILSGGLATGGGDLTADRTIVVPKAAQADVAAGTDDAKALTSLSVAPAFAARALAARKVATSGLATGGGDLTADRTIAVPVASQADVAAGTDNTRALTALSTAAAFAAKAPNTIPSLFTHGAPAIITDLFAEFLTGRKFGLYGDATDQTTKLNYAIAEAAGTGKRLDLAGGYYGVNPSDTDRCLTATAMFNLRGEGGERTVIYPMSGAGPQHAILKINPVTAASMEFTEFSDFMIYPAATGTKFGGMGIVIDTTTAVGGLNLSSFRMDRVYISSGNDYSMYIHNDITRQAQGCPNNSVFSQCSFYEGFLMRDGGDSNRWVDCVFRSSSVNRSMIDISLLQQNANGASVAIFDRPNIGGLGGVVIRGGRKFVFRDINAELGNDPGSRGSPSGALIDILGDITRVYGVQIRGGLASVFGDSTASTIIRVDNAADVDIDEIELSNGKSTAMTCAIKLTSNASNTHVGNISSLFAQNFGSLVDDSGTGTRGIAQTAILAAQWSNVGQGYSPATYRKDKYGQVTLDGLISGPSAQPTQRIFTLPGPFAPAAATRVTVGATIGGNATFAKIDILTTGDVVYQGPGAGPTELDLCGINFQTTTFHTSA